jgi:pimeloyl-ACP methyl ester carboxylesterase
MTTNASAALELATTVLGQGPPVVVLHGLLGRARNWLSIARSLERSWTLHLVDLRNHGASPWSDEAGYAAMAADVAALIERQAGGRARLVGHSMGGKVAMALALVRPELVERLIVVDIAPVTYRQGYEAYIRAMQGVDLGRVAKRADADAALAPAVPDPAMRGFLLQNLESAGGRFAWQPNLDVLLAAMPAIGSFPPELAGRTFAGPSFALRGERSDYVDTAGEAALRRLFPAIELLTVPDAGHWPHAEQPAAFLRLLEPCLASAGQRGI